MILNYLAFYGTEPSSAILCQITGCLKFLKMEAKWLNKMMPNFRALNL